MKNLTKLGVASALISVSLLFCACGSEDKREIALQKKVKEMYNAQLLSFEEAKKESSLKDLKDKDCLKKPDDTVGNTNKENYFDYRFVKKANGEIGIIACVTNDKSDTYSFVSWANYLDVEDLKSRRPECFN